MRVGVVALCVLVLGCGPSITVPHGYGGKIRVRLTNDPTTTASVCSFTLRPMGGQDSGNWLGFVGLARGKSIEFNVRKGKYFMSAEGCQNTWIATATDVKITKSTELIIASNGATSKHPDFKRHVVAPAYPKESQWSEAGGGGGEQGGDEQNGGGGDGAESEAEDTSTSESNETPAAVEEAPRPTGRSCKKDGAKVSGSNECCSSKTRNPCTDGDFCGWVCCSGGPGCQ